MQDERVPEYWILDPDGRVVERWTPDDSRPEILAAEITWHPEPLVPPLVIDLPSLFADALD